MKVKSLEDLKVWQRAKCFAEAVSALTRTPAFARDSKLREQLDDCADSIVSNIAEGFGQSTDRAFARYLFISRGSALEARTHLAIALVRHCVAKQAHDSLAQDSQEIEKMLVALIRHLLRCNWKNRV